MLTPAEEVGLAGHRLARRVDQALRSLSDAEMRELLAAVHDLATERHLSYQRGGATETIRLFPSPITLRQDQLAYIHYVSQTVLNCVKRLPEFYFADPLVRDVLRVSDEEEHWLLDCWTAGHRDANPIFSRLDAVVDFTSAMWKDTLRFLEPNLTGIGGVHLAPTSDRVLADVVIPTLRDRDRGIRLQLGADIRELLLQDLLEHLEAIGRPEGRIVLLDPKYELDGPDEPEALARYYRDRHGIEVLHADPAELRLVGDEVYFGDARVDIGYRDYGVLDLLDLEEEGVDVEPMRRLFKGNRMVSSIAAELDQKSCWEIFTDPDLAARYFSTEERQILRRHIPWTRIVADRRTTDPAGTRIELLDYLLTERETLVLKPNRSYGGEGVTIGPAVSETDWDAAIKAALEDEDDRWVVQQLVALPVQEFPVLGGEGQVSFEPFYVVLGFVPSRYGVGLVARASQKQVVNVAQHGGECAVMVSASHV
ncbi:MAG: hypothetical protein AB7L66_15835 [Gemmatimonadales bacterium]